MAARKMRLEAQSRKPVHAPVQPHRPHALSTSSRKSSSSTPIRASPVGIMRAARRMALTSYWFCLPRTSKSSSWASSGVVKFRVDARDCCAWVMYCLASRSVCTGMRGHALESAMRASRWGSACEAAVSSC